MARKVEVGTQDVLTIQNKTICAVDLTSVVLGASNKHGATDFKKAHLRVSLTRGGHTTTIVAGNFWALAKAAYFGDASWDFDSAPTSTTSHVVLVAPVTGVGGQYIVPLQIPLGGCLCLTGSDRLDIEVDANWASTDTSANSYTYVEAVEGTGVEYVTPQTRVVTLTQGDSDWSKSLGNNVTGIWFVSAKDSYAQETSANQVISSASLKSDKMSYTRSHTSLVGDRAQQFEANFHRGQCFRLAYEPKGLDSTQLDLIMNGTNVGAGNTFLVVQKYLVNRKQVAKARGIARAQTAKLARKIG